jgi:hypothetical protein
MGIMCQHTCNHAKKFSKTVLVGQFGLGKERGEEKETHLRSLISLKNCKFGPKKRRGRGGGKGGGEERGILPPLRYAPITVKYRRKGPYLYVRASTLLGLPVTQGGLA